MSQKHDKKYEVQTMLLARKLETAIEEDVMTTKNVKVCGQE